MCVWILHTNLAFGSEPGMPQLNTEYWAAQIFWLIIIFSILYLIIWKIFLPKITYSIENRKSKIVTDLNDAQKLKESAENKLNHYNEIIEKAKKEAKKIVEDSKTKLDREIESKKKQINNEIEKEISSAEKEINELKKNSILNINNIAAETSFEVIKQVIDIEVNKSSIAAIVDEFAKKEMEKYI